FVDLSRLSGAGLVIDAIATALDAKIEAGLSAIDALVRTLEGTQTLIILDNCEHLLAECAEAVSALLRASGDVRVLATSREPLGLAGEMMWRVGRVSLAGGEPSADDVGKCEAVPRSFARAAGVRGGVSLST